MLAATLAIPSVAFAAEGTAEDAVTLKAADAQLDGVTLKDTDNETAIAYDEADDCILGIGEFSTISYEVPEIEEGQYDIYLEVSKASNAFVAGSTPVTVTVNDSALHVPSVPVMPCAMDQMGMDGNPTYQQDMGLFLVYPDVELSAGDTIVIGGVAGNEFYFNESYSSSMPAIGDVVLYPAGTVVEQGYEGSTFEETAEEADASDPLSGLNIAWLGSSVTYGQGASGYSMADVIAENHPDTVSYKYAISGTTLADYSGNDAAMPTDTDGFHGSYVSRMEQLDKDADYDLFIVQLSTNDATGGIPMGEISDSKDINELDDSTVIGAMEYIIAYAQDTWGCPVMFYTGTKYDSEQYGEMVDALLQLKDKWDIGVIDLWNNEELNSIDDETRATYIKEDGIHPLKEGYVEWWTPAFEEAIIDYIG